MQKTPISIQLRSALHKIYIGSESESSAICVFFLFTVYYFLPNPSLFFPHFICILSYFFVLISPFTGLSDVAGSARTGIKAWGTLYNPWKWWCPLAEVCSGAHTAVPSSPGTCIVCLWWWARRHWWCFHAGTDWACQHPLRTAEKAAECQLEGVISYFPNRLFFGTLLLFLF